MEMKLPASHAELRERGQIVAEAEAATYHAETVKLHADEYAPGIAAGIRAGLADPATAYVAAQRARLRFRDEVMALIGAFDALLTPVAPSTAPVGLDSTDDASLCSPWSWTGAPAIALPSGVDGGGLPHIQFVQAAGADGHLLGVPTWCERILPFESEPPERP
jgi:Asp-tRNA(Asn)/Glu-tRNA(Gln) amidotransferase A subunit family amidase